MYATERYRSFLRERSTFSEGKINRICYAVESIINDITKMIMLIVIGWCTGKIGLFISILMTYTVLRPFLGGNA